MATAENRNQVGRKFDAVKSYIYCFKSGVVHRTCFSAKTDHVAAMQHKRVNNQEERLNRIGRRLAGHDTLNRLSEEDFYFFQHAMHDYKYLTLPARRAFKNRVNFLLGSSEQVDD
ncbi:hypothetical protein Ddc_02725 [Ditylenchus destructor]|nr:hypothetical protein Ddc_02725 [Ditylenchus destructor]